MPSITSSINIGAVTYASGEAFSFAGSVSVPSPRLTIDAQVPADVAKVESVLPGNIAIGTSGELYVVNTSTTTPLIIKLLDQNRDITAGGRLGRFIVRGAYISIGTGTGADGQSVSTVVGGKSIDWPPFVEVETAAGSGVYVSMLNIHGNYQNDAAALPTVRQVFASVGTTKELGCFFEYDEINRSIKFGGAGGGWVPPAGANIRIPNIHFTAGGVPVAAVASRSLFPTSGFIDLENCSFSNRFAGGFGSQSNVRLVNVGLPAGANAQGIRERLYFRNVCIAAEVYATGTSNRWNSISNTDIDGLKTCILGNASVTVSLPSAATVENASVYQFGRGVTAVFPLVVLGDASDETRKRMDNILVAGGGAQLSGLNNLVINGFYPSDTINSTKVTTLAQAALQLANNVINSTVQRVRIPVGGTPSYTRWLQAASTSVRGCAVHDVVYDGDNHTDYHIASAAASRLWIANQQLDNPRTGTFTDGAPNSLGYVPLRASAISGATTKAIMGMPGAQMSMVKSGTTALITNANGQPDMELLHTTYTGASGGVLTVLLGSLNINAGRYEVLAGVDGVDYRFGDGAYTSLSAASDIVFTSKAPARGITSFAGCALSGSIPTANTSFRMRAAGQGAAWPATWTAWSAANLTTEFDALVGYSSSAGFDMQVRVVGTGASIASTTSIGVTGLTVDAAFAPYDVGFVEIAVLGGQSGAVVGIVDTFAADVLFSFDVLGASGAKVIDYPYNYDDGIARPYRLVSRKVGYLESMTVSAVDQTGATVPVPLVVAHPCVSSSVVGVTVNGAAKTLAVAGGLDFLDVYQHAQWWATQRENIVFDTPMTSTDGQVFEVPLSVKVQWPSMGTDGTLAGGWLQLAAPGTHTYKLSGTKIEFQAAGSYNMSGTQFGGTVELVNTSGGAVTVSVPSGTSYTNTGPGITVTAPTTNQSVTVNGLEPGSRIQIYDLSSDTELYNGVVAGSSHTWSDPSTPVAPRTIRLRAAWASGTVAKQFVDTGIGTCGTGVGDAAVTYLINQQADAIYGANAVDGSTVTGITIVDAVDRMQINIAGGTVSWMSIYAYNVHWLTTEEGIRDDGSIITAKDVANYTLALFKIKNTSAVPLQITGGYGVDSATGSVADILDVTGGSIFPVVDHVVSSIVTVSGANVITGDIADIPAAVAAHPQALTVARFLALNE